jgi:hypothetical protein
MNNKILGLLAVGLMAGPISANAQATTYTYQGDAFTGSAGSVNSTPPAGWTSINVPRNFGVGTLNGFIILSAPLGDNLNNVSVTPAFVDISTGSPLFRGDFTFSTNANGAIDGWSMSLNGSVPGPGGYELTATSVDIGGVGGDSATMSATCTAFFSPSLKPPQSFACGTSGSNMKPGVWTSPAAKAPEIDPASAVSGLTLLLGGVAVLRGRRKVPARSPDSLCSGR